MLLARLLFGDDDDLMNYGNETTASVTLRPPPVALYGNTMVALISTSQSQCNYFISCIGCHSFVRWLGDIAPRNLGRFRKPTSLKQRQQPNSQFKSKRIDKFNCYCIRMSNVRTLLRVAVDGFEQTTTMHIEILSDDPLGRRHSMVEWVVRLWRICR